MHQDALTPAPAGDLEQQAPAPAQDGVQEICCEMTKVLLGLVRSSGGDDAVAAVIAQADTEHGEAHLLNGDHWISHDEACSLLETATEVTGDPMFARHLGEATVPQNAGSPVATVLRSLGSVEAIMQAIAHSSTKFSTVTEMETTETAPGSAVVTARAKTGFTRRRPLCDWAKGLIAGSPILFGLPAGDVVETECQASGDAQCRYIVTWNAADAAVAADPQERVTALERQLKAMSDRLHNVYAIASDLVSTDDLDTVLHRIVERTASAVRAPGYILAVRTTPNAELQVYSRGIDEREAREFAEAAVAPNAPSSDSALVAEVSSSRRDYGRLIARYPAATSFLPQEQELLALYAKLAAAVLDIATSLQESAQRNAQVTSLLSLAQAAAQAGTSHEVGERLAAAVPEVIDCDRVAVWQWDDRAACLRFLTGWGQTPDQEAAVTNLTISPGDAPNLESMLTEPKPRFYDESTDDPFMTQLMAALDMAALVVVPIVAHEVFLGVLIVVVEDDPQRLRPDDNELLDQLTGVAAVAAPAIQNGLLVDQLAYKASHDSLTGLLNRVGFREHIDRVLGGVEGKRAQVGLLFVDLDEFKHVNDAHGHDFGDELLRQAADRLTAIARGSDVVARLGGDEFAVVLSDVHRDDQVRAAEGRVREAFGEPFQLGELTLSVSASVGGGIWPEDGETVADLVRHADAAMYQDKAQGRRRRAEAIPVGRRVLAAARAPHFGPL